MYRRRKKGFFPTISKRVKGIIAFGFLGGIMLTSGVVIGIPGILPNQELTPTNTPQDRFTNAERPRFCGTPGAGNTPYITEFEIQRECTQPLAITTDENGDVWFTQTNTGNLGRFDPTTLEFAEFYNPNWTQIHSMMWGITPYGDDAIWYTEDSQDAIWKYDKITGEYLNLNYNLSEATFPHRIVVLETLLVINDYTGDRISFFNKGEEEGQLRFWNLFSPLISAIISEVAFDSNYDMWYANWHDGADGLLVKFSLVDYYGAFDVGINGTIPTVEPRDYVTTIKLPKSGLAINGVAIDYANDIWLTDTNSSDFYGYSPQSGEFTRYSTPPPDPSAFGNSTGIILEPITRPYLAETDYLGRIVFNEQTANRIGVFDPQSDSLIEYTVPSKNPFWSDCDETDTECGIAQVLGFHPNNNEIWFTEWVENNIGVLDTSIAIPYTVKLDPQTIYMNTNSTKNVTLDITVQDIDMGPTVFSRPWQETDLINSTSIDTAIEPRFIMSSVSDINGLDISKQDMPIIANSTNILDIMVTTENIADGTYKVALGVGDRDVNVSSYLTIIVGKDAPTVSLEDSIVSSLQGLRTESGEPISIESIDVSSDEDTEGFEIDIIEEGIEPLELDIIDTP